MPRRRKKSTQQSRPSLVFTESPIHKQSNVPSPVLCAENPTTARSVPVEDIDELAWVSPQFRRVPGSVDKRGRKRVTRQRRKSTTGVSLTTRNINKENTFHGHTARNCKFKSLKFVGDQATVNSLADDVDITCDTDTENEGQVHVEDRISDIEPSSDDRSERRRSLRTNMKKTGSAVRKRFRASLENIDFDHGDSESEPALETPKTCFQTSGIGANILKPNAESTKADAPVKRLFASQFLGGISNNGKVSETDLSDTSINSSDVETVVETSDSDHHAGVRRTVRIQMLRQLFLDQQTPCKTTRLSKVLVSDTPHTECGMPLRKRQLRRLKKQLTRSRD